MKRSLPFFFVLICNTFLFAQAPSISYSGVQSSYNINSAITPLTPTNSGGLPSVRTNVSTIAGSGTSGYIDGSTASPKYYSPTGIAIAASGNIYVADSQNHCIRKISSTGYVTTFAGTGVAGFADGNSNVAQFNTPFALAVDASENIYVTETSSDAVRKITAAGVVSTFAGNVTTAGYLDGQGTAALFSNPKGLDVDSSGNVYVADSGNNRIRKITSTGLVSTFAGDGTVGFLDGQGTAAKFSNPIGVAIANSGTIYISDTSNNRIRAISNTGLVTTLAGNASPGLVNGQGTAAQFNAPRAIAVDASGNVCVVDYSNNCIRKITSTGSVSTLSGTGAYGAANGVGTSSSFKYPEGIAFDSSGNAFVADVTNNCIRKITSAGDTSTYSGTATSGLENGQGGTMAMFNSPVAVAVTSTGITYAVDDFNSCIRKITSNGIVSTFAGNSATGYADGTGTAAYFNNPKGIAIDAAGNIYVADTFNNRIRKITSSGVVTTIAGDGTAGYLDGQGTAAKFNNPYGLTVDTAGNIYVADTKNHRIRKISTSGAVTTIAGYILSGYADGASTVARFKNPQGITIDNATGILYVVDTTNNRIRKIATDGTVSTFAGSFAGYSDDQGTAAYFNNPIGIAIDASGNFYIGDYYNSVIRKIDTTGLVSTYAGSGSSEYNDGIGNVASFYFPVGVATDTSGNVYVADSYTQRIRKITSVDPYTITPALPTGISFNTATGVISGTPTQTTTATAYTIGASNYTGTGTTTITFATGTSTGPSAPTASAQTFCTSATVANLVATGTALKWYNVASGGTALASTTALSTGTYYVTQTVSSIESSRTSVAVTVNITAAPTASAQSFCNAATVANLVATGTALQWYTVSTGGTALASTTSLSTGTYYVSQTLNSCEGSRTSVSVTINTTAAPTASAQAFCTSATVANLVATGTVIKWYNVASGGTALASTTALLTGTYYLSQTLNSCESSRTSVSVTINTTAAPIASAQTFNNSATVANLVASGTVLQWYTVATSGTALASTTALSTGTYYVSQTVNSCESSRTLVSVTVNAAPGAPTASAQTFCNAATVASLVATGTALQWYSVATGGTALPSTTALSTGTYYVSQTVSSIESSRTAVSVTINTTTAPTASAQAFCTSATVANLVATGTSLKWYTVSTGGTALASTTALSTGTYYVSQTLNSCESTRTTVAVTVNTTAAPTASAQTFNNSASVANLVASGTALQWYTTVTGGAALASTTALSTGTYYVSQTLNSCESTRTLVSITVNTAPGAPTASAQTFCNLATVANLVATGTALQWYNVSTGGTVLASTTVLATGTYYVSQTVNSIESSRTAVSVTINSTAAPTASAQTFNNSASVANLVATGTALQWYTTATGGTVLASTTALSTGTYYVSQTLNSCESTRTLVSITVNTAPGAPTASAQTFCNSATVANLVATGTALQWYTVSSGGTALALTTALSTGTYYVSQTVNSIESSRTAVSVTINITAGPTASAQAFCASASVANLVASGTSLQWYNVSTSGTALASTTALSTGTYYVSQTLNSCESSRAIVSVAINTTTAPTASSQTFNNSASVANLVATGTALQWYTVATGGTALASTTALSTGTYYVSQTLNSCESSRTLVSVTVNTAPGAPTASAQTFCNSATVANLVATGTLLQWYDVSTGGLALTTTIALSTGTYYVSQTVNSIESSRTAVSVTINITVSPTASAQAFCTSASVSSLVATGTSLQWYNVSTGGTALTSTTSLSTGTYYVSQTLNSCESSRTSVSIAINTTAAPTASAQSFNNAATVANLVATGTALQWYNVATGGTALASTTALSTGTYYVSQIVNSCESSRTSVSVSINVAPGAPTASSQTFCSAAMVSNLVATGTALKWYNVATGGTALASNAALGTGNYYVSQTVNSIESSRTTVFITVNITTTPTASAQTFCTSATVGNLVATGTALKWYNVASGGTALTSTTALITANYYVSQTVNTCESSRAIVAVTINPAPSAPTAASQIFCSGATITNLVATGTSLKWYDVASGGTALASTTSLATGTYYVSQTVSTCESSRTTVSVTVNTTSAPTASAQTFCNSAVVSNLVATGTALKWYNVSTGGTALTSTTALVTGTYYVSQTLNSCESSRTNVAVTINTTITPTATAQTFCSSATVANLVATGAAIQWYNVAIGGTALASTTALTTGTYYVSQILNSCESSRASISVTINTTAAPTASGQVFCNGAAVTNLVATGTSLKWYNIATGGTALVSTTALSTGTYYVSQTLNSCESSRTAVAVSINTTAVPTASAQTFNNTATIANLVASGSSLQWYTVLTGGTALASTTALTTGTYYVSQTLNSCESSRTAVAVTINGTPSAPTATAQSFCISATVANLVATGTSLKWYNVAIGGTALSLTTTLVTGTYYVSQTVSTIESPRTAIAVTVNTTATPGVSPQTFCNSATVASLVATGSAIQWYTVATGGMALTSTTALTSGGYYVSQTVNGCESSRIIIGVTINTTATPSATAQTFCTSATVANLVATGTSLKWYNVASGGTPLVSTTALATGTYYVSQTLNSCESLRTAVAVTINTTALPTATAQTFCTSATVANLVASGNLLKWYTVASGGTALASTTALASGIYYVSQTVSSCESARTTVAVTINITFAPTATSQTFNTGSTVANLVAAGTSLKWYTVATGGTALTSTTALVTGNYYVSQTLNSCESSRTLVAVTINAFTSAPVAVAQEFCSASTVSNLVATGASLKWYTSATGGTALASSAVLTTGNYYVSQTVSSIESARTLVSVTVYGIPVAKSISSATGSGSARAPICISETKVLTIKAGYSATSIQWERAVVGINSNTAPASSAYATIVGATGPSYTVTNASAGKNYFRAKFINGNCDNTAVYSTAIVYYKECASNKLNTVISYPNPFADNFSISLSTTSEEKVGVAVFDMTGRLIEQREVNLIDVPELKIGERYPSGIYNVVVTQGDGIKTTRVIKQQ